MRRQLLSTRKIWLTISLFSTFAASQSKRGLGDTGGTQTSDDNLLLSANSPISWYFTWSLYTSQYFNDSISFVPLIHGLDDASSDDLATNLDSLPVSSTHLLTFNEPDGTTGSGGSSISPKDAAQSYIDNVVPLRSGDGRTWNISHPVVTGSSQGLDWLTSFNESCWDIDSENGCPADFVAVHWYGDFAGLSWWLDQISDFYNPSSTTTGLKLWITEMAIPKKDEDDTISMLNQSITYLDGLDDVEGYAWFGAFRADKANDWTGDNVSLFDDDGGLTELGALYLGGKDNGFEKGMKGEGNDSAAVSNAVSMWAVGVAGLAALVVGMW
ncbi:glycosyl hydrolase catalytic core-domain-containing protein [Pseudomassariella vexata]|uniref:Glycosyl hydrolase catalytic core-domain-containing protein n=1 Tax=Pseudomassariella vexata TaxID=1141098 RepID=A0A1Y2DNB5_9PEZI|nr:glycosyl hydrolase catalytic core-domain-containing protein [Pseudomassariella vexata]ORY60751.1 glycosyl hydrolase catalytic core-domain-containing protein [Pseudomassariella vexata]